MSAQLVFELPSNAALGRDAFFVSPSNALAVARLERWLDWPDRRLVLSGPNGAGKTHLAGIWASETGAAVVEGADMTPDSIAALGGKAHVVVENADRVAGHAGREAALFHLYNLTNSDGAHLLLTASRAPALWPVGLPDLASRLQSLSVVSLEAPDDALLSALLVKLFADRQVSVSPQLVAYLLGRMERSAEAAQDLVRRLDQAALAEKRPLTRHLAARVLDRAGLSGA